MMDLKRLRIDRSSGRGRRQRSPAARWAGRIAIVAILALGLYLFRKPLTGVVDRLRLPTVETAVVVERGPVEAGAIAGAAANGYIVARTRAALSADTPGRIVELNVEEGQAVRKGFVVARLYADEYAASLRRAEADVEVARAAVRRAEADRVAAAAGLERLKSEATAAGARVGEVTADLELAELNLQRTRRLTETGVETDQLLDDRKASVVSTAARLSSVRASQAAAQAAVDQGRSQFVLASAAVEESRARVGAFDAARDLAAATLDKTEIRAPFDGIIVLKDAEVGEVVSPNSTAGSNARGSVVTMVDFDSLEVQAEVPETTLAAVRLGGPARIFLDAHPERPYKGRVDRIWPTADRQKATIEVRVAIEDRDDRLRPEMGVRVVFLEDGSKREETTPTAEELSDVLVVPADALVRSDGQHAVFVLERDVARLRPVVLGDRSSDRVVIRRGLEPDEKVIRSPPSSLDDGERVLDRMEKK